MDKDMKIFLFYVNAIVGLDEWTDRKLLFQVNKLTESDNKLALEISTDEPLLFRMLNPRKSYALQFEEGEKKELKYYTLKALEIVPPTKDNQIYDLILHVDKVEV
jgi:hypothetical protein